MRWFAALLLWASVVFVAAPSRAQDDAPSESADHAQDDRAAAFRAVRGAEVEQVPGGALLIGAYGAVFALMLAYVWRLGRLHAANTAQLERLAETLESAERREDE